MIAQLKQWVWLVAIAIALSSCSALTKSPETNIERLALLELSYDELLQVATLHADEGRISFERAMELTGLFDDIETGISVAKTAISISDQGGFDNSVSSINALLITLRTILAEIE